MAAAVTVRPVQPADHDASRHRLWDAYNAFHGRLDATALPEHSTRQPPMIRP